MKKWMVSVSVISMLSLIFLIYPALVKANTTMNFSVTAVLPENQMDKSKSYFSLKMKPGQTQTVSIIMNNSSNRVITVKNYANVGVTNDNGVIDYSFPHPTFDDSLKIPFGLFIT